MERGENRLIIQAAAEGAFDFKAGSPRDPEYILRLGHTLRYLQTKNMSRLSQTVSLYNVMMCIQRTVASSKDLGGDLAAKALDQYRSLILGSEAADDADSSISQEDQINYYRKIYEQFYGKSGDSNSGEMGTVPGSSKED